MNGLSKTIAYSALGAGISLVCGGCGAGFTVVSMVSPTINQFSPQMVQAGTPSVTVTIQGANFDSQAALTVDGAAVPTKVVNSTTLAAQIGASALAKPAVTQLQVRNASGVSSNKVDLTVTEASNTPALTPALSIATASLAEAQAGGSYSATLAAGGGTPGYTWTVASGSLPAGLTLSSAGVLSGTPSASGTFTFTLSVSDAGTPVQTQTATLSIAVAPAAITAAPPLSLSTTAFAPAQVGTPYSGAAAASGGTPGYTWAVVSGSLPPGLILNSSNGAISGTPSASATWSFTLVAMDSGSPAQTVSATESITVAAAATPPTAPPTTTPLSIDPVSLGAGQAGSAYSASLSATGGTPGYTWSLASGNLPAGLTLASNGTISGTPTAGGTFSFAVAVSDSGSPAQTQSAQESIVVSGLEIISPPPTPSGSASLYLYPMAPVAPRGSYQTVTAVVTGSNDKTVTWTSDGGSIVGANPCVVNEPCTVALYTTTPGTYHLTAKSNANGALVATSTITFTASPVPVTTHPRLGGITAAMLPELRAKAVSSNPLYMALYSRAVNAYTTDSAIWSWSCKGGSGKPSSDQTENYKEGDAYLFAFMSMVDPNDSTYNWGCYGRDIWMYYANFWQNPLGLTYSLETLAVRQVDANYGLTGNHGSDSTEALTLTPDWLMAGGYLSASDLATTRAYFALASRQMITIALTGVRAPVGNYNSPAQINSGSVFDFVGQRAMGNNYTHSKIMYLTAAALTFNDTVEDDPALANTCGAGRDVVCPDGTAGSLHAYWKYLVGGMLYKDWAHMEDPGVTLPAYEAAYANLSGMPTCEDSTTGTQVACMGDGRGGESSEGSWYQYSMYRLRLAIISIASAGYADPILYGPQMSLATSSWWDMKAVSDLEFLTYSYYTPQPRFAFISTGDTLNLFRAPSDFNAEAWMMVSDSLTGRTDRTASLEWPLLFTSVGGVSSFYANLGNAYGADNAIPLFMALPASDPTANPPADPRPGLPTDLFNGGNQHILVRSGWDAGGTESASWGDGGKNTVFSYYCQNSRIDHEHETCGGFDVLSDGEYITKTRTVFNDYNMMLATAEHSNEAGYDVDPNPMPCTQVGVCFEWQAVLGSDGSGGGELWHGYQAGSATLAHAEMPGYVAAVVDTTQLYNGSSLMGWGGIRGVTAASRSLIYLRGSNQIVYYDRGAGEANRKRLWATTTGPIAILGSTASWPTRSGRQEAYLTSLLPADAKISDAGAYKTKENGVPDSSDWEPYSHVMVDAGSPAATQFLTVMEWGGSSFAKSRTVLVQSTAGQKFDGALVGGSLVMFMRNWPSTFTGVTYPASGATAQYVSDLTPNTAYTITGAGAPASATTDDAGVLSFQAEGTGDITVGASQ